MGDNFNKNSFGNISVTGISLGDDQSIKLGDSDDIEILWDSAGYGVLYSDEFWITDLTWAVGAGINKALEAYQIYSNGTILYTYADKIIAGLDPFAGSPISSDFLIFDETVDVWTASKSGTTVTKTIGPDFTASDVGKYIFWSSGTIDLITAFIGATQVTVATSGTISSQAVAGHFPLIIGDSGKKSIGIKGPASANADMVLNGGVLSLKEASTPTADTDFGKIYTKNDNKLYFQDGAGVEHEVAFV